MRILAVALAVLMSVVHANATNVLLPDGCYVAFQNPGSCYEIATGNALEWVSTTDTTVTVPRYGQILATIISNGRKFQDQNDQCIADYNELANQYNNLNKTASKLVKKLRSACGKKCKKIK